MSRKVAFQGLGEVNGRCDSSKWQPCDLHKSQPLFGRIVATLIRTQGLRLNRHCDFATSPESPSCRVAPKGIHTYHDSMTTWPPRHSCDLHATVATSRRSSAYQRLGMILYTSLKDGCFIIYVPKKINTYKNTRSLSLSTHLCGWTPSDDYL